MKTIRFNTGRSYTKHGQRIIATLHDDGVCTFSDIDRMVTGEFRPFAGRLNELTVMAAYDHNIAKQTQRSWEDAMLHDGCNAKWEV